jgi:hypothetical protein
VDQRRLADIRAGTADQQFSSGSGYLVGRRLVLTCQHVIFDTQGQPWPRLEVRLGHPTDGLSQRVAAQVVWSYSDKDVALLRIADEPAASISLFGGAGLLALARFRIRGSVIRSSLTMSPVEEWSNWAGRSLLSG